MASAARGGRRLGALKEKSPGGGIPGISGGVYTGYIAGES